jgi:chromate reductase, NAD(P)H dehydrogenase (quinone)
MEEIVVISCTNRVNSNTLRVCRIYQQLLGDKGVGSKLFDLSILPHNIAFSETFGKRTPEFSALVNEYLLPFEKFIFVVPEYNGSFPGILKTFLDSTHPREWNDKNACLVGIADGRAGNLRGLEHLTGILNYLQVHVYHNKLPISAITHLITPEGTFSNPTQLQACSAQLDGFLRF